METIEQMVKDFCDERGSEVYSTEYYRYLSVAYRAHTIGYSEGMSKSYEIYTEKRKEVFDGNINR